MLECQSSLTKLSAASADEMFMIAVTDSAVTASQETTSRLTGHEMLATTIQNAQQNVHASQIEPVTCSVC